MTDEEVDRVVSFLYCKRDYYVGLDEPRWNTRAKAEEVAEGLRARFGLNSKVYSAWDHGFLISVTWVQE